jgi:hypothetical protein
MSGIRQYLRNLEHSLPNALQRSLIRVARDTPYSPEYEATRSIFIHIPKTAGTSVGEAIYGRWVGHVPISRFVAFDASKSESFFKFSFVRNPWDRLLSGFAHLKGEGEPLAIPEREWSKRYLGEIESFENFVLKLRDEGFRKLIINDIHFRPQMDWITLRSRSRIAVNYLGRFESLDDDFSRLAQRLGVTAELPLRKQTKRPPYRDAYSKEMRRIAEQIFRRDIERLGYSF